MSTYCSPNSYRVICDDDVGWKRPPSKCHPICKPTVTSHNILCQPLELCKAAEVCEPAKGKSSYTRVLRDDVKVLMAPVTHILTDCADTNDRRTKWFQHQEFCPKLERCAPGRSDATTSRTDYLYRGACIPGNTRRGANPCTGPAIGIGWFFSCSFT